MARTIIIGVYKIQNIITNNIYVGSTSNFNQRKNFHLWELRHNKHNNKILQKEFNDFGEKNFKIEILEITNKENLILLEQKYFDILKPYFNIKKIAGFNIGNATRKGILHTIESRKKISKAKEPSRKLTDEQVIDIRLKYIPRNIEFSSRALAKNYNVSHSLVGKILRNEERIAI